MVEAELARELIVTDTLEPPSPGNARGSANSYVVVPVGWWGSMAMPMGWRDASALAADPHGPLSRSIWLGV